jgi:hypothetical protein
MNNPDGLPKGTADESKAPQPRTTPEEDTPNPGPNLTLLYSLIALALLAAIGFAILIVLPFYHRR